MGDEALVRRVGVVVTTHEGPGGRLDRCLDAIAKANPRLRIVVVDNSGSGAVLGEHTCGNIEHVRVDNRGFGAAANAGFAQASLAGADAIGLLNDDVAVDDGWLEALVSVLDSDPIVGAVQPKLVLAGTVPPLLNSLGVEIDEVGAGSDVGYRMPESELADDSIRPIEAVTGGALLLRRSFIDDVIGFDERLFLYYEDVDLCLRGSERGWQFRCAPTSRVEHDMGATTGAMGDDRVRLQERNRLVVAARFADPATIGRALWLSIRRLRHEPRRAHRKALLQGVVRVPRALSDRIAAKRRNR